MDSTMMTRVIGLLHRRGWVVRQPGADRRQRIYAITPNGVRQLDAARLPGAVPGSVQALFLETTQWRR